MDYYVEQGRHGPGLGRGHGRLLAPLTGHKDWVISAEFSPDAMLAVTASRDGIALVWQHYGAAEWRIKARFFGHGGGVAGARFSSDSRSIITASKDGTARMWRLNEPLIPSQGLIPIQGLPGGRL